jgi:hypothetical protein
MFSFLKPKIQIVELNNGNFAVMKTFLGRKKFFSPNSPFIKWRESTDFFFDECQFKTIEKAEFELQKATGNLVKRVIF